MKSKINIKNIIIILVIVAVLGFVSVFLANSADIILEKPVFARPSSSGKLHVTDTKIYDENNRLVQLKGLSSHGISYCPNIIDPIFIENLSRNWNANIFRAAMYSVDYVEKDQNLNYDSLIKAVNYAIKEDMYVIIDWHTLTDNDPNKYSDQAVEFFKKVASLYADTPNVIYEICNEPNGGTGWVDIYSYADKVIPQIKAINEDATIIVGTPNFCQDIDAPSVLPLTKYSNILYSFHFYAGTHYSQDFKDNLKRAITKYKIPVIVSEFGITDKTGDGELYFSQAADWIDFLNKYKLSYLMWSYSDIKESSATFKSIGTNKFTMNSTGLTTAGRWARDMLANKNMHNFSAGKTSE